MIGWDRAQATATLTLLLAPSSAPVLADTDVTTLLDMYRCPDVDGRYVDATGYVDTWDRNAVYAAAAAGWEAKAARVVGDFTFSADDASYSRDTIMAKCLAMAAEQRAKINGTIYVSGAGWDTLSRLAADQDADVRDYVAGDLLP